MQVQVRYFAVLRERAGCAEDSIDVQPGVTVGQLYASLFPPSEAGHLPIMFAVNEAYVHADRILENGDEVAFIPPLGGG